MNLTVESTLIGGSFLLFISIVASKISTKLGIPTLLIFLLVGMAAGYEHLGNIEFDDVRTAKVLGAITLSIILFSGGIETEYKQIKPVLWSGILLATVGILITTFSIGYFIYLVSPFSFLEGLLIGSIISSTDAAAVFSVIKSKNMHLKANLGPLLELESGSNDTMAYFLMVFFTKLISFKQKISLLSAIPHFIQEMATGGIIGFLVGRIMLVVLNKVQLSNKTLYPGLILAIILFTYSSTTAIGGNGFLAVYIAGLILGSNHFMYKESVIHFCEGLGWIMQIIMFITLGLLVKISPLLDSARTGIPLALFLMFIARPISIFISLFFTKFTTRHKLFVSWVGLRGAVPIVFATFPILEGVANAHKIYHVIFFVVFISILLQGTTLYPLAKYLQLESPVPLNRTSPIKLSEEVNSELIELLVPDDSSAIGKKVVQLSFPEESLILLIKRGKCFITPRGNTTIVAGDKLMVILENQDAIAAVKKCLEV